MALLCILPLLGAPMSKSGKKLICKIDVVLGDSAADTPKRKANNQNLHIVAVTGMAQGSSIERQGQTGLNKNELGSLHALFEWTANEQNMDTTAVKSLAEASMGVNDITKLSPNKYDEAIRFLVDLHDNGELR